MKRGLVVVGLLIVAGILPAQLATADEVVVATNSVWLKKGSTVSGDVVVNDASLGPTLEFGVELQIDTATAIDGSATGDSIGTEPGTPDPTGGYFCNELDGVPCDPLLDLPVFDTLPPFEFTTHALDEDVSVPVGGSDSIEQGSYRDIVVGRNGTLCFEGGDYDVNSISADRNGRLLFAAPTVIRMDGALFVGASGTIGPDTAGDCAETVDAPSAAEVVIYVASVNADPHEQPAAVHIGKQSVVGANFYALNGTIDVDRETDVTGLLFGKDVIVDRASTLTEESAFVFGNQPPTADPQDVATDEDNDLEIILTGSDPEGGSLTFDIVDDPTEGTVSDPVPIVPDPVGQCSLSADPCDSDADCPGTETCEFQQPATTSATVIYTPPGDCPVVDGVVTCPEDSFTFKVTDPEGLMSEPATVGINAPGDPTDPPPDLEDVVANPLATEVLKDSGANPLTLTGAAPCVGECDGVDDVELTFSLVAGSGPSLGTLGALVQGSEVPQRSAAIDYTPDPGVSGTDSFDFQVAGDTNDDGDTLDPGETDVATVTISVQAQAPPVPPVADDVQATTEAETEVMVGLSGTPGSGGGGAFGAPFASAVGGSASESAAGFNGGRPEKEAGVHAEAPVPITIGAGWSATSAVPPAFFWGDTGQPPPIFADDGPFTFSGEACVSVTDDFITGDQFKLYDNGDPIGTTPLVPGGGGDQIGIGPEAAYDDPIFSSGSFDIPGTGSHSIEIEIIPPNSLSVGRGYIRVDPPDSEFCDTSCGLTFTVEDASNLQGTLSGLSQTSSSTAEILYDPGAFVGVTSFTYRVTDCFNNFDIGLVDLTIIDPSSCSTCNTLTVSLAGPGVGDVTSNPTGIACPSSDCSDEFTTNSAVVLQARPIELYGFGGWSGATCPDCAGSSFPLCTVVLTSDKTCTATFSNP